METVFDAENSLEAHMVAGLLEQHGIGAWVLGDTLQGGVGELPAGALVRVVTNDDQASRARDILREWEREQHEETAGAAPMERALARSGGMGIFLLGLVTGVTFTLLLLY